MCWCGKKHDRGDMRNGEVRHFVSNWSLYQLRNDRREKDAGKEREVDKGKG